MKKRKKRHLSKAQKKRMMVQGIILFLACVGAVTLITLMFRGIHHAIHKEPVEEPMYEVRLLTVNPYSRPGYALEEVKGIVIHYTANPGTSAMANRDYFEQLKDSHERKASSHFIVGLTGEIIQCIPTAEISYASNQRNGDTIAIEVCHADTSGKFEEDSYESLVHLTAWLCDRFGLQETDVIRHYDVSGKNCPKYYVEHEEAWEQFLKDVKKAMP